jgi:hypothetical protein
MSIYRYHTNLDTQYGTILIWLFTLLSAISPLLDESTLVFLALNTALGMHSRILEARKPSSGPVPYMTDVCEQKRLVKVLLEVSHTPYLPITRPGRPMSL